MVNNSEEIIRRQLYSPADRDNRPDTMVNGTRARCRVVVVVMLIISLVTTNGGGISTLSLFSTRSKLGGRHSLGVSRASTGISFNWTVFPICLRVSVAFLKVNSIAFEGREEGDNLDRNKGIFRSLFEREMASSISVF